MDTKRDSFFLSNKKQGKKAQKNQEYKKKPLDQKQDVKKKKHDNFDKNREIVNGDQEKEGKKPFDKKTYRLKKYSKKYKLEQWEEQRKKKLIREYHKEVKNDPGAGSYKPKSFDNDETDANESIGRFVRHPDLIEKELSANKVKKDPFRKAKEEYNKVKQDKLEKQQEMLKAKEQRQQKLQEYKKKKQDRFKKLSKKNKKGQPDMTGRLELLLEKIQGSK